MHSTANPTVFSSTDDPISSFLYRSPWGIVAKYGFGNSKNPEKSSEYPTRFLSQLFSSVRSHRVSAMCSQGVSLSPEPNRSTYALSIFRLISRLFQNISSYPTSISEFRQIQRDLLPNHSKNKFKNLFK